MLVYGHLVRAQIEPLAANPTALIGRVWHNTVDGRSYISDGTLNSAVLTNDGNIVIGTDGTASNNVRIHRAAATHLQVVDGSDSTAEGVLSTSLAQLGARAPNFTTAGRPAAAAGNAGRTIWNTDLSQMQVDKGGTWDSLGAGGSGSGGVNHLSSDNSVAENGVGDWVAYADAAGTEPVDGTSGSPTVTLTRTTTDPLRGDGSFLLTKDAANRQGEGASVDFVIARSDAIISLRQEISFELEGSTDLVVGDGGDVNVFIYDVDGATLIRPEQIYLEAATGKYVAQWDVDDTASRNYRLILHISTTSALAWTVKFDLVSVGPPSQIVGPAMSDWQDYTPTGQWTTNITYSGKWRRVGDSMEIMAGWTLSGVPTPSGGIGIDLPPGYTIDTSKFPSQSVDDGQYLVGEGSVRQSGITHYPARGYWLNGNDTRFSFLVTREENETTDNVRQFGLTETNFITMKSGDTGSLVVKVPIVGWSTSVSVGNGQTFRISSVLANGTRVTATPTKLGEWRSQIRTGGGRTFSDTSGTPAVLPSAADGIKVYNSPNFATSDTNFEPSRYEIFVGKNKQIKMESYLSAGRTGFHDPSGGVGGTTDNVGYVTNYDPTTGVFLISPVLFVNSTNRTGRQNDGDVTSADWFMDIVVSENVQAIGVEGFTRWVSFTPTLGSDTSVTTKEGAWRRVGQNLELNLGIIFSGAGGNTSSWLTLPNSLEIDFTAMGFPTIASASRTVGFGVWQDAGAGWRDVRPFGLDSTTIGLYQADTVDASAINMNEMANTDQVSFSISVPIVGW